ncbi:trans-Golgi network integral membrane protein 2-like [Microplitis mediator]|uniref:trans-Golgi network integral membrane protein 2-like n=1 Tax=Microplitis mediator TaxID=375433 RepID=UPI002555789D|nr:trans-Golgi network integral membrane protein 2-like [Microplitis mediator]
MLNIIYGILLIYLFNIEAATIPGKVPVSNSTSVKNNNPLIINLIKNDSNLCPTSSIIKNSKYTNEICSNLTVPSSLEGNITIENVNQYLCLALIDRSVKLCRSNSLATKHTDQVPVPTQAEFDTQVSNYLKNEPSFEYFIKVCHYWGSNDTFRYDVTKTYVDKLSLVMRKDVQCSNLCVVDKASKFNALCVMVRLVDKLIDDNHHRSQGNSGLEKQESGEIKAQVAKLDVKGGSGSTISDPKVEVAKEAVKNEGINGEHGAGKDHGLENGDHEPGKDHGPEKEDHGPKKEDHGPEKEDHGPEKEDHGTGNGDHGTGNVEEHDIVNSDKKTEKIEESVDKNPDNGIKKESDKVEDKESAIVEKTSVLDQIPIDTNEETFSSDDNLMPTDPDPANDDGDDLDTDTMAKETKQSDKETVETVPRLSNMPKDDDDSHFFGYFTILGLICGMGGCLLYHHKQKILAILLEGRRSRGGRGRRRPSTASYRKLDCTLEEAVTSQCNSNVTNVIY